MILKATRVQGVDLLPEQKETLEQKLLESIKGEKVSQELDQIHLSHHDQ